MVYCSKKGVSPAVEREEGNQIRLESVLRGKKKGRFFKDPPAGEKKRRTRPPGICATRAWGNRSLAS